MATKQRSGRTCLQAIHTTFHPTTHQSHPTTHNSHTCIPIPNLTGIIVVHPFRINIATINHHTIFLHTTCIITIITLGTIVYRMAPAHIMDHHTTRQEVIRL